MLKAIGSRILHLLWKTRPLISVCSNCNKWRLKDGRDQGEWRHPHTDPAPHASRLTHGLCDPCHDRLYPTMKKRVKVGGE